MTTVSFDLDAGQPNVMPVRYRQVSLAEVPDLEPSGLIDHLVGREAYRHTRFIVACRGNDIALVEIIGIGDSSESDRSAGPLFSAPAAARVLADASECVYLRDESIDTGIGAQMALAAANRKSRCVVVEGRYHHVSFILNPQPVTVEVVDIVPPLPAKLVNQVRRVLDVAEDLPPLLVSETLIDSRDLLASSNLERRDKVLMPCRGGGVDLEGVIASYLDERPALSEWTLLGCHRSRQIHTWFYGTAPAGFVDTCPRTLLAATSGRGGRGSVVAGLAVEGLGEGVAAAGRGGRGSVPAGLSLSRCCLLEEGVELRGSTAWVPWGASLAEVLAALRLLIGIDPSSADGRNPLQ